MTPERWQHIDRLFQSALERTPEERAGFLKEACAGDDSVRAEVESLISAHERSGEFLDAPAYEGTTIKLANDLARLAVGQTVGHYKILGTLGAGGMGEVYLAQDTRLGRKIAVKLLPREFTKDVDRLRRFEQEARAASALSHPNVCVIHEISETEDGRQFIAMEHIEGMTVRQRQTHKRMKLDEALDVATQIAAGLAAAHAAGIVHRDIKPENVMLRSDGLVKVLDFGLAKLTERQTTEADTEARMRSLVQTGSGMIMGTVAYMSPEQARGMTADARTDIWSLGVVLYEMVAGQPPFAGATPSDLLVSILDREPPALTFHNKAVPTELERIARKALKKDREERYQVIKDMALDLKSLRRELEVETEWEASPESRLSGQESLSQSTGQTIAETTTEAEETTDKLRAAHPTTSAEYLVKEIKRHKIGAVAFLAILILVMAGIFFGWRLVWGRKQVLRPMSATLFQRIKLTKLTTNGRARCAAIAPDGRYVAYAMNEGNRTSLWVRQVATAGNVQIVKPAELDFWGLTFTPDGNYVYYVVKDTSNVTTLYKVPALGQGSAATRILEDVYGSVGFSPDGKQITFVRDDPIRKEARLMIAKSDGSEVQEFAARKYPDRFGWDPGPAWSPDGKLIACSVVTSQGAYNNVILVDVSQRTQKLLSPQGWDWIHNTRWLSDGSGIIMSAKAQDASFVQVWLVSYPSGEARSVTSDLSEYYSLSLTADSNALVGEQDQSLTNIWIVPQGDSNHATQLTSGAGRYFDLSWTSDGKILYASDASGSADIWEMQADGKAQKQLTVNTGRNYAPVASPDGRYVVFHSNRAGGTWNIWRMDRDGSNPKQLTFDKSGSTFPQISTDGQWVVYEQAKQVWKLPIDGGTPVQLTGKTSLRPVVSPDGKLVACWQSDERSNPTWRIALIPFAGGEPLRSFDVPQAAVSWDTTVRWTPDGHALTYRSPDSFTNIWKQPLDGGKPVQLTDFKSEQIFEFAWSRDGQLLVSRGLLTRDVVLIADLK
jgi:eukaryotic-like serine/threonine-protein kinase